MELLIFQLRGSLSSWGGAAVGEYRGSDDHPSESALIGVLGAALGTRREDDGAHEALRRGFRFAVGTLSRGSLLRDYHTAQVPPRAALNGRPHATRKEELGVPKEELRTVLSARDYRQDGASLIAVQSQEDAPCSLEALAHALRKPYFTLYLGRKSCPPTTPLYPQIVSADSVRSAFERYREQLESLRAACKGDRGRLPLEAQGEIVRLYWSDGVEAGVQADFSVPRKDRLIRRRGWQFGDRIEYAATLRGGD